MSRPPIRLIVVAALMLIVGVRSLFTFEPKSAPFGLFLPLIPGLLLTAAGAGLLFRQEWARQLGLALCYFCLLATAVVGGLAIYQAYPTPKLLAVIVGLLGALAIYLWMLSVMQAETIKQWMKREETI